MSFNPRLPLVEQFFLLLAGVLPLAAVPTRRDGTFTGYVVYDPNMFIMHLQPIYEGPKGGLFVITTGDRKTYINQLARGGPGAAPTLNPRTRRRMMRATTLPMQLKERVRLCQALGLIRPGVRHVTAGQVLMPPLPDATFSGFFVDHPAARTMHGLPVWEGPNDGLFVRTRSGAVTYINELRRGSNGQELSPKNRRGMIRAVVVAA